MTKQVYEDLKELEAVYKKLTCSIQQAFNSIELKSELTELKPVIHAKWEDGSCTNCHCDVPAYIIDWRWVQDMDAKYCPNCGAKMDKE